MAYISKKDILAAYKKLSEMHPDPNAQGATQKVSAIRHFFALDSFYKRNNRGCNTRDKKDKEEFSNLVGIVSDVCLDLYTTNFYYPLKKHGGDYSVGSNFYSAGQVSDSLVNTQELFEYPKRGGKPLIKIQNGVLLRDVALYENFKSYISSSEYAVALIVWMIRKINVEQDNGLSVYQNVNNALSQIFTSELMSVLVDEHENFDTLLKEYDLTFNDNFYSIKDDDIKSLFGSFSLSSQIEDNSRQIIYYGAPGTGKSHKIKSEIKVHSHFRTTFHPDSDYSTFVGAYKPKMEPTLLRDLSGHRVKDEKTGNELWSKQIVYDFVPQAFLKAYLKAWEIYPKKQYLIIEEINRGNCAQIFGDLFQLLDRNRSNFSDYPITVDDDLQSYIKDHIKVDNIGEEEIARINEMYSDEYDDVFSAIKKGEMLLLPSNLYIWATMNTSDQSLFPIDSAFKRRWDWKYIPIRDAGKAWTVKVDGADYDWWDFVEKINLKIWDATHSEDKKLGYFFCKADEQGVIAADKFVGKVLFYVYNDVFKDYGLDDDIFKDEDGSELLFHKYFNPDGTANEKKIARLLQNIEVKVVGAGVETGDDVDADSDNDVDSESEEEESSVATTAPASALKVQFADGVIEGETQFDSYLAALKKIGMEQVAEVAADMEYNRFDCPLVGKKRERAIEDNQTFSYVEADGYYVVKGMNKRSMVTFLNHVADKLGIELTAE